VRDIIHGMLREVEYDESITGPCKLTSPLLITSVFVAYAEDWPKIAGDSLPAEEHLSVLVGEYSGNVDLDNAFAMVVHRFAKVNTDRCLVNFLQVKVQTTSIKAQNLPYQPFP